MTSTLPLRRHLMWPEEQSDFYTRVGCGLFVRSVDGRVTNIPEEVTCDKCKYSQRMKLALARSV